MKITLNVNGANRDIDVSPDTPVLWILRDTLGQTGTKYGCGKALCGSCTVLIDGSPVRSCVTPVSAVGGSRIVTIEGLSENGDHPLQKAWVEDDVPQCGYCQPGQILVASALLARNNNPTDEEINAAMSGVLCRCGTYQRIRRAIRRVVDGGGR